MSVPGSIDLSRVFGPVYWGFVMSQALGGICVLQAYLYFTKTHDSTIIRSIAATMIFLDIASSALVAQSIYYYLIPHFGSLEPLSQFTLELSVDCLFSTVITFISQMFFARQIYFFAKNKTIFVPAIVAASAFCAFVFGLACTTTMIVYRSDVLGHRNPRFVLFFGLQKGFSALTDILATVALCSYLWACRTNMFRTNSLIKNLMEITIQRGTLVTVIQNILVITYFAAPRHVYWLAIHINLTKLYANVFFAMLNARSHLHEKHAGSILTSSTLYSTSQNHETFRLSRVSAGEKPMPLVTKSVIVSDI